MATVRQVDWTPDQVTSLPQATVVTFEVKARAAAERLRITYTLISPRLRFAAADGGALIPPEELAGSDPTPEPQSRKDRVAVDDHDPRTESVTRVLVIEQVGSERPGVATLKVAAEDVIGGVPQNRSEKQDSISFVFA